MITQEEAFKMIRHENFGELQPGRKKKCPCSTYGTAVYLEVIVFRTVKVNYSGE
jgi:hypothetical protein